MYGVIVCGLFLFHHLACSAVIASGVLLLNRSLMAQAGMLAKSNALDCTVAATALWAWNGIQCIAHERGAEKASEHSSLSRHLSRAALCNGTHHNHGLGGRVFA